MKYYHQLVVVLLSFGYAVPPTEAFVYQHYTYTCSHPWPRILLLVVSNRRRALSLVELHQQQQEQSEDEGGCGYDFSADYTGTQRQIQWKSALRPVPLTAEVELLKSGALLRRGEFNRLEGRRIQELEKACCKLDMTLNQGLLIRKQVLMTSIVHGNWKLNSQNLGRIQSSFTDQQTSILDLTRELNLPPVGILRAIITSRVEETYPGLRQRDRKKIVQSIIREQDEEQLSQFLTGWEIEQLQIAKENDVMAYQKETGNIDADLWEESLYDFLDELAINFVAESEMRQAGSPVTPDCLLLDNVMINGRPIRWIDVKCFYASGLKQSSHMTKKIKNQIARYQDEFGEDGAVVFKHGFSRSLQRKNPDTLFLDAGPLEL
jgi:hypothetical protein